jgi:hypothetical protein
MVMILMRFNGGRTRRDWLWQIDKAVRDREWTVSVPLSWRGRMPRPWFMIGRLRNSMLLKALASLVASAVQVNARIVISR